jgi:hypothetical protein
MEKNEGAANDRHELEASEECRREDRSKMQNDADSVNGALGVVIAIERPF